MSLTVGVTLSWAADARCFVPAIVEKGDSFLLFEVDTFADLPFHDVCVGRTTTAAVSDRRTYTQLTRQHCITDVYNTTHPIR